jgi:magnesium-transporting ATPase (P-type)
MSPLKVKKLAFTAIFMSLAVTTIVIDVFVGFLRPMYFFMLMVALVTLQIVVDHSRRAKINHTIFIIGLIVTIVAFVLKAFDNVACMPESILQGHALWHVLSAAASLCMYLFYYSENEKPLDFEIVQEPEPMEELQEETQTMLPFVITEEHEKMLTKQIQKFDPTEFLAKHYDFETKKLRSV